MTIVVEGCEACVIFPMHPRECTASDKRWGGRCNRVASYAASPITALCRWHKATYAPYLKDKLVRIKQP